MSGQPRAPAALSLGKKHRVPIKYGGTADGGTVVRVLCYESEGRWFDSR
jgi:hypothetical protein